MSTIYLTSADEKSVMSLRGPHRDTPPQIHNELITDELGFDWRIIEYKEFKKIRERIERRSIKSNPELQLLKLRRAIR